MRVEGSRSFAAPRDTVWGVLNDPQAMAELMPGVESFDVRDDRHWIAQVKIPLGLGGLRMKINFDKLEEREPEFARLRAKGQGVGALMDMVTQFHLDDVEGGTNMRWEADVKIAGPVGSMGQRVLQPIVNQQVSQVLNALDRQVQKVAAAGGAPSTSGGGSAAPAQSGAESSGTAGAPPPSTDAPTHTKPEFYEGPEPAAEPPAPPSGSDSDGTSGADQGVSPWSPEGYDTDPEGPTTSTEDRG